MDKNQKQALLSALPFIIGWIGWEIIGGNFSFEDIVVGLLIGAIIGLVVYIRKIKK